MKAMSPPLFVIGSPHSGTTLLRLMLTYHKEIMIYPESSFAAWLYKKYCNSVPKTEIDLLPQFVSDLMQSRKIETWKISEQMLIDHLRLKLPDSWSETVSLIYEWYGISIGRSFSRWGDNKNFYLNHIPTIEQMFSDAFLFTLIEMVATLSAPISVLTIRRSIRFTLCVYQKY